MESADRPGLAELVSREAAASLSTAEKLRAVLGMRLHFERPEKPGFYIIDTPIGRVVPVFTSVHGLARFAGLCDWASTTAEDLVELLPTDVPALVDPRSDRPFLLDGARLANAVESTHASVRTEETEDS
ncbi:hypothetical protein ACZ90_31690 [Streptomyces albus subsp. albus]|nr:hypothetical protein ACZ90_31690 [Streptomyces albus subsp. albus]